ncbi:hypothetical protein LEN26_015105 [Aphanomyces euteiches]|nr:hypothetical protein LEN26_015105 [Aphanomyces euteiches]KAH9106658.1 hypothetical protein AeMF1_017798 [Aphanomyces euteiches]KAH9196012.1 hypothetical protein AeNC1_001996 [Aphanomyces euteiches]
MIGPNSPFGNLMAEAVKLKGAQQAQLRPVWDSWPQYFQHSMFMQEPIVSARTLPFHERFEMAVEIKAQGNAHFAKQEYEEAVAQYEKALALFKYCENTDPEWKKKGIRDDDIRVVDFKVEDDDEGQNQLDALKVSLYLNISGTSPLPRRPNDKIQVCKLKMKEFALAISACGDVLKIDPHNAKAYYRRAQALITPLSSGAVEFEKALVDLELACQYDPENVECRKLYRRLREEQVKQRKLDHATFSGMFNRGTVIESDEKPSPPPQPESLKEREMRLQKEVEDAEAIAHMYEQNGSHKQASELREKIKQVKDATRAPPPRRVDFFNPTEAMIEDGKKNGIDLTDKRVQQMLSDLQEEHLAKGTMPSSTTASSPTHQATGSKFEAALVEADEILATMSKEDIAQLLRAEGIDSHSITDKDELKETVRSVLATKLQDLPRPGDKKSTAASEDSDKSRSMRSVFALVGLWVIFRMYSSGGFSMLAKGFHALAFGPETHTPRYLGANNLDDFDDF